MSYGLKWVRLIPSPLVEHLATLGPLGFMGRAPGTVGSVAGLALYIVFFWSADPFVHALVCAFLTWLGVGICTEAERRMQKRDPGEIIYDEFVAMPLVFVGLPMTSFAYPWLVLLLGFGLFRFFDIVKPLGIGGLQNLPDGVGVMMDDTAAALASSLCLHLLVIVGVLGV